MLMKKADDYLALRRAAGYALEVPEYHLRNFVRFAAQRAETLICTPMPDPCITPPYSPNGVSP